MITSVLSFPDRGKWGNNRWRGNCSGWVYHHLFTEVRRPKLFVDPCVGGGTSVEVANELQITAVGLDLHSGFNLLKDSLLDAVGQPADMVVSHFPYHDMIVYSGDVWGQPHPDDLSRCVSVEDFIEKSHLALVNQREATAPGGLYGTIIGDLRRQGAYYSFQSEFIARMPGNELKAVLIKAQHNVQSDQKNYGRMGMPKIMHEYVILWEKPARVQVSLLSTLAQMANQANNRLQSTWRVVVKEALVALGGEADLSELYAKVEGSAASKVSRNDNWKAKVRQVLTTNPEVFAQTENGHWKIAA